jgi:hypothetical protein
MEGGTNGMEWNSNGGLDLDVTFAYAKNVEIVFK